MHAVSTLVNFVTLVEMYDRLMERFSRTDRCVLRYKSGGKYKTMAFAELDEHVTSVAAGLAAVGVHRGDRIALISENRPEWIITDFALMHLGAINVSIFPTLAQKQIQFILQNAGVTVAIVSNLLSMKKLLQIRDGIPSLRMIIHFFENDSSDPMLLSLQTLKTKGQAFLREHPDYLRDEKAKVSPDDLLTLIYTSGTTGTPRGVELTHRNLVSNISASADSIPFSDGDSVLSFLPLCHSYERMAGYYAAMACGVNIAYAESVDTVFENLVEIRPTVVTTVPRLFERMYQRLMRRAEESAPWRRALFYRSVEVGKRYHAARKSGKIDLLTSLQYRLADKLVFQKIRKRTGENVRFFISGGAPLSRDLGIFFEAVGILILEGYGMTEASPVISFNRLDRYKFGTVGLPIPNVQVKISYDNEILVKGPNVMRGYWGDQAATREVIDGEGWLHTGDIGFIDQDGFLVITDRKKHLFVTSGGKNIAPQHIESLFLRNYLIDQFILIGDGRKYLTAIIVPNFEGLRQVGSGMGLAATTIEELARHQKIYEHYEREMNKMQKELASYERIRKFAILDHPLTIEEGEITPAQKVKRKIIEERYKAIIEKMYSELD